MLVNEMERLGYSLAQAQDTIACVMNNTATRYEFELVNHLLNPDPDPEDDGPDCDEDDEYEDDEMICD